VTRVIGWLDENKFVFVKGIILPNSLKTFKKKMSSTKRMGT